MVLDTASQQHLFATSHRTAETSILAYRDAFPKQQTRRTEIILHLTFAGIRGLTRHQLTTATGFGLSSICGLVRLMLDEGLIVEPPGKRRKTPSGCLAKVLTLPQFKEQ